MWNGYFGQSTMPFNAPAQMLGPMTPRAASKCGCACTASDPESLKAMTTGEFSGMSPVIRESATDPTRTTVVASSVTGYFHISTTRSPGEHWRVDGLQFGGRETYVEGASNEFSSHTGTFHFRAAKSVSRALSKQLEFECSGALIYGLGGSVTWSRPAVVRGLIAHDLSSQVTGGDAFPVILSTKLHSTWRPHTGKRSPDHDSLSSLVSKVPIPFGPDGFRDRLPDDFLSLVRGVGAFDLYSDEPVWGLRLKPIFLCRTPHPAVAALGVGAANRVWNKANVMIEMLPPDLTFAGVRLVDARTVAGNPILPGIQEHEDTEVRDPRLEAPWGNLSNFMAGYLQAESQDPKTGFVRVFYLGRIISGEDGGSKGITEHAGTDRAYVVTSQRWRYFFHPRTGGEGPDTYHLAHELAHVLGVGHWDQPIADGERGGVVRTPGSKGTVACPQAQPRTAGLNSVWNVMNLQSPFLRRTGWGRLATPDCCHSPPMEEWSEDLLKECKRWKLEDEPCRDNCDNL